MYRNRYVIAEGVVVQNIYSEEEKDVYHPALYGNVIRGEEERGSTPVELRKVSCSGHEDKLNKGQKRS